MLNDRTTEDEVMISPLQPTRLQFIDLVAQTVLGKIGDTITPHVRDEEEFVRTIDDYFCTTLPSLAERACVDRAIIEAMIIDEPVSREDAQRVLEAFSQCTGKQVTLEMVDVTLQSWEVSMAVQKKWTFMQLRDKHHFGIVPLAQQAAVHSAIVYRMLLGEAVPRASAIAVLNALSEGVGEVYTLETVEIKLAE